MNVDFTMARMAHQTWRLKLRSYLNGGQEIDPTQLLSHRECSLGKWIYSSGTAEYGHFADFHQLEQTHKDMHQLVTEVVRLKRAGKSNEAAAELLKVNASSEKVVALITSIEAKVEQRTK